VIFTLYAVNTSSLVSLLPSSTVAYHLPAAEILRSSSAHGTLVYPQNNLYASCTVNLDTSLSHTLKIKMRYCLAVLALAVAIQASPFAFPGGVTSAIAPPANPPPGCTPSHASFGIAVMNISTAAKQRRQVSTISEYVPAFMSLMG
jgi:hypothetical protein